jgi:hypothetical protein
MSYFGYLPNTIYRLNTPGDVAAKNILVRAKIKDSLVESESTFLDYNIRDGETPESLSHRVYGKSDYHWMILMFNEIHDVYNQWPMSANDLENMMMREYPGKALFIDPSMMKVRNKTGQYIPFDRRRPHFEVGTVIEQVEFNPVWNPGPWQAANNPIPEPSKVIAKGVVKSWDPNLYKLEVESTSGIFQYTGYRETVELSGKQATILRPGLSPDIRFTNSEGLIVYCPLVRIVQDNKYAIHHFMNEEGNIITPTSVLTSEEGGASSLLIDSYAIGNAETFSSVEYGRVFAVNNFQHENMVNESKRTIKMMRPKYIDAILKEMRILSGR